MAKKTIIPGGRLDRANKAVKRAGVRAAAGAATGAAYAQGLMIDAATPQPMVKEMMASLPDTPTAMLVGAGLGVAAGPVAKGLKHVMNKTQFKGN